MGNDELCEEEMIAVVLEAARVLSGEDTDEDRRHTLIVDGYLVDFLNSDSHAVRTSLELTKNVCLPRTTPDSGCLESFHVDMQKAKTKNAGKRKNSSEMTTTLFSAGGVMTRSMRTKKAMS